ncbi:DUF6714 family protein [Lysobacter sp. CA196]|uniref:DUF6714 family protein n=1 Tax=Lysobacter sp. CA196 TaxID=3455606 RepID=UPI003F8D2134
MDSIRDIVDRAFQDGIAMPTMSLRAGNALDSYDAPPPFDAHLDRPVAKYLETHHWGVAHLDPISWRYYLPALLRHALLKLEHPDSMAIDALLSSLRPPDRDPPRFASLSQAQAQAVVAVLDALAFEEASAWKDEAIVALEEYWAPGAHYRDGTATRQ